jgi:hypothetical protein
MWKVQRMKKLPIEEIQYKLRGRNNVWSLDTGGGVGSATCKRP